MNQIIYLEKEKLSKLVIEAFVGILWIFSIGLIIMSIYNIYDINRNKLVLVPDDNNDIPVIVNNEITNNEVINNEITNNEIINNEITNNEIINNVTINNEITNNQITNNELANNQIVNNVITNNEVIVSEKDTKPPTIKIVPSNETLVVKAIDEGGMDYITYSWDGGTATKISVNSEEEITIEIPEGEHEITIKAHDTSGNVKKFTKKYTKYKPVEPTPTPTPTPTPENPATPETPVQGDRISPSIYQSSKTIAVYDAGGLSSVKYSVNGTWYTIPLEGNPTSIKFTIQNLTQEEGKNKVKIIAIDKSGNQKELEKSI